MSYLSYKDFLNQELDRASKRKLPFTSNHINYHKWSKTIKRKQMIDRICDIIE